MVVNGPLMRPAIGDSHGIPRIRADTVDQNLGNPTSGHWKTHIETHSFFLFQVSSVQNSWLTFRYNGWLIGILVMAYYNPYIYNWVV